MKKLFIILVLIFMPCSIIASSLITYDKSLDTVNYKIIKFDRYSEYLVTNNKNYQCVLSTGKIICSEKYPFLLSGYLNFDEYAVVGGLNSYLNDGASYFTMTTSADDVILIVDIHTAEEGYKSVKSASVEGYTRITQYVNSKTDVLGSGTYVEPWTFDGGIPAEWLQEPDIAFGQPEGTQGDNNWYKSNITVNIATQMPEEAIKKFEYCVTTEEECIPDISINSTSLKVNVTAESDENIICATVQTIAEKEISVCSDDENKYGVKYKIDKTAPTCEVSVSGNDFAVTDVVESLSKLPTEAYSWISSSAGFGSAAITASTDALQYTAWVKDNAGNVGLCSKIICSAWSSPVTSTTTSACSNYIASTIKISECATLYTCSKTANVTYSCPYGTLVSGTDYCSGSITKTEGRCGDCKITKGTTYSNIASSSACISKCGGERLTCNLCGTWSKYYYISSTKKCECRTKCSSCVQYYNYSCSSGGSNQENSWCKYTANKSYSCDSGYSLSSTTCSKENQASCASGYTATATTKKQYSQSTRTCSN